MLPCSVGERFRLLWDQNETTIQVRDTVTWDWRVDDKTTTPSQVSLYLTGPPDTNFTQITDTDFGRYNLNSASYSYTFSKEGTYYYAAEIITNHLELEHGTIYVTNLQSSLPAISVCIGDTELFGGIYCTKQSSTLYTENGGSSTVYESGNVSYPFQDPVIIYSASDTPVVDYVEPKQGIVLETIFTVHGTGFSASISQNVVMFGHLPCDILNSSNIAIRCKVVNSGSAPIAWRYYLVSVLVLENNIGYAFIASTWKARIQLLPKLSFASPLYGSLKGGTDVVISGSTFSFDSEFTIGFPCKISQVNLTEIRCKTLSSGQDDEEDITYNISICTLRSGSRLCVESAGISFTYSRDHTPSVTNISLDYVSESITTFIYLYGDKFSERMEWNRIHVGNHSCNITKFNQTLLICAVPSLTASSYQLSFIVCNASSTRCLGYAQIHNDYTKIIIQGFLTKVSPSFGSIRGGTELILEGSGFHSGTSPFTLNVTIGYSICYIRSVNFTTVRCVTSPPSANIGNPQDIQVLVDEISFVNENITFTFSQDFTPNVTTIVPGEGQLGETINITATLPDTNLNGDEVTVQIGGSECNVSPSLSTNTSIICSLGVNFVGNHSISIHVYPYGLASITSSATFEYSLRLYNLSVTQGSFAGGNVVTLYGAGFDPSNTCILICGKECRRTSQLSTLTQIECSVPRASEFPSSDKSCYVELQSLGRSVILLNSYNYSVDLTPLVDSINRTRGGTAGGSAVQIIGSGFTSIARVTIAGATCTVVYQNEIVIDCITGASSRTVRHRIFVFIDGKGFAWTNVIFWYVDLWSSQFTWKNHILPSSGDFVVIPKGQTLVLDIITPILSIVVIQGGELIFDEEANDNQVALHTQRLLIVSKGRLEIGTEQRPFLAKTEIVLYGNVMSTELPQYGTKNIALREGEITVHGRPINVTWTRLISTALAGEIKLYLRDWVTWEVGGKLVIASTSFSQRENEVREIQSISSGVQGSILVLTEPLEYEHISIQQIIAGRMVDTSAEVGYLTRNIVFRGNRNEEWSETITACEEEFRPGPFQVQTCFRGRFGDELASDYFGGHIFIQAAIPNTNQVTVKLAFVEITEFGQAFRLGRHPINFHLNGNMSGSYVNGCSICHSFNRAITIHNTDHLLLENNVVYDILGHGYSLEDGQNQYNILQDNLGILVKPSTSSLNVDMSPAVFWVVNANNIVRHNAAAGSSHFGFWYQGSQHGTVSSSTCLQKLHVLEFEANSAHSMGLYGLWILRHFPSLTGLCGDNSHIPSHFDQFLSWNNNKGIMCIQCGSVQVRDSIIVGNIIAGIEFTEIVSVWGETGALISKTVVAGYSHIHADGFCTHSGLTVPASYYLTVSNVTFVGFDKDTCYAINACASPCRYLQGGFETRYEMISFINVTYLTRWNWVHQHIHYDLDGTLTGTGRPSILLPTNDLLDPSQCRYHSQSSTGNVLGSICNGTIKFGRVIIYSPVPQSLRFTYLNITNDYGTIAVPYVWERSIRRALFRYMAVLQLNVTSYYGYLLTWVEGETFTNISYQILTSDATQNDYFLFSQDYPQALDRVEIQGIVSEPTELLLEDPASSSTGDYTLYDNDTSLSYVIKGTRYVRFSAYKCFYEDCIVPPPPTIPPPMPPERSNNSLLWSLNSSWPDNQVPQDGQNVTISGVYMLLDITHVKCRTLEIVEATLEILDGEDRIIEASYIIIRGGRMVAGYPNTPFLAGLRVILHGDNTSPELRVGSSAPVGGRSIAVFGELILNAPPHATRTWTMLSTTAEKGSVYLSLIHSVDWLEGDLIVITSTSYDPYQSEVRVIKSISADGQVVEVNDSLKYTHIGKENGLEYFGAEVGLLSRTIVIENGNPEIATQQSFGCRVLVSQSFPYQGIAVLRGVEFKGCGQLGYTESFDPRFALVFLNLQLPSTSSNVTECSFHSGFNTAIGVIDSNNILIEGNVIHGTVGASMRLQGSGLQVTHNLASLAQYIGLFQNTIQRDNPEWTANYDIDTSTTSESIFEYNSAAGGAMACFHLNGEYLNDNTSLLKMRSNMGHSCLHGIHLGFSDGHLSGSKFENFTLSYCFYFALFSHSPASIVLNNSVLIHNKAAIYISVIGPSSLSHEVGEKWVIIENTIIISKLNSTTRCQENDSSSAIPPIVAYQISSGILSPSGGHVGIVIPSFLSDRGQFPRAPWHSVISYPAINGSTSVTNVTFMNFGLHCNNDTKRDVLFITNPSSEDANHPVYLRDITESGSTNGSLKVYIHPPSIGSINPSDCVDMYCDGMKNVLLKDLDGSFTGRGSPHSIIPLAELGWDGADRRVGIGDYRIPVAMLSNPDGSRINVNDIYPLKGIVRGETFGREDECSFVTEWNAYLCSKLDHLMLVMESLDADTEVRRLSPIAYGANGFVNLVNGPMDHGFCGGYSCQERISTFYFLVAEGLNYTVVLTSTNPQNLALHLLHANDNQTITVAIIYDNPQRLDVYVSENGQDNYIVPNNAYMEDSNLKYREGDPSQFVPTLFDSHGSNVYDRNSKILHITIRGKRSIKIITTPVIMVSLSLSVDINDFFDETLLVETLAFLLDIPANRIRMVSVTRETTTRRKRQTFISQPISTTLEIGSSPLSDGIVTTNFTSLSSLSDVIVDTVQTGLLNYTVTSFNMTDAQAPVVDPTGGVRATEETGGLQPDEVENSTLLTFYQQQLLDEESKRNSSLVTQTFTIPCSLAIKQLTSSNATEGLRLPTEAVPKVALLTCNGSLCTKLGLDTTWVITVSARIQPDSSFLTNTEAKVSEGIASFDDLIFSHPGSYLLFFSVTYPEEVSLVVTASTFITVLERQQLLDEESKRNSSLVTQTCTPCSLAIKQLTSSNATEGLRLPTEAVPKVALLTCNGSLCTNLGFDMTWVITVSARIQPDSSFLTNTEAKVSEGIASFDDLIFSHPGSYLLFFSVTYPEEVSLVVTASNFITVLERQQVLDEESKRNSSLVTQTCTPCSLAIKQLTSSNATEGLSLPTEAVPKVALLTCNGSLCTNLGLDMTWVITVSARMQPDSSFLTNTEAKVSEGIASFDDLIFSHPGSYLLFFSVTYPEEVSLVVTASTFITVLERQQLLDEESKRNSSLVTQTCTPCSLAIKQLTSSNATEGLSLPTEAVPKVALLTCNGSLCTNFGNTTWVITVSARLQPDSSFLTNTEAKVSEGIASFDDLIFSHPGSYLLFFSVTYPVEVSLVVTASNVITVLERQQVLDEESKRNSSLVAQTCTPCSLAIKQLTSSNATEGLSLPTEAVPKVALLTCNGSLCTNLGNTTWVITVSARMQPDSSFLTNTEAKVSEGIASFDDLIFSHPGSYLLFFSVTYPEEVSLVVTASNVITVLERQQVLDEESKRNSSLVTQTCTPCSLAIKQLTSSNATEGLSLPTEAVPKVALLTCNGSLCTNLGNTTWVITVSARIQPDSSFLTNTEAKVSEGIASFDDLIFSHPGSYLLFFSVTYPEEVSLVVTASNVITVLERQQLLDEESKRNSSLVAQTCTPCSLEIKQLTSSNATEGLSLPTEAVPKVALLTCNGSLCTNLGNTTWVITVSARMQPDSSFLTNTEAKVSEGIASFDDLIFSHPGSYLLFFSVTYPEEVSLVVTASNVITVLERQQLLDEESKRNSSLVAQTCTPCSLAIKQLTSSNATEGLSLPTEAVPKVALLTCNGSLCTNLGNTTWVITVSARMQPDSSFLTNTEAKVSEGIASFDDLIFSHPGSYLLFFSVTYPVEVSLVVTASNFITVLERQQLLDEESKRNSSLVTQTCTPCSLAIKQLTSSNATEGLSLPTEAVPKVALLTCNGSLCTNLGNTTWVITVSARMQPDSSFLTNTEAKVSEGIASFDDLIFSHPGSYLLFFSVTYPEEVSLVVTASTFITVLERQQLLDEESKRNSSLVTQTCTPCSLAIKQLTSSNATEGLSLPTEAVPKVALLTCNGSLCTNLGNTTWVITVSARIQPDSSFLTNTEAKVSEGIASFDDLIFSHPGSYILFFSVTYPEEVSLVVTASNVITVLERQQLLDEESKRNSSLVAQTCTPCSLAIKQLSSSNATEGLSLPTEAVPKVALLTCNGSLCTNLGNTTWVITVSARMQPDSSFLTNTEAKVSEGIASFDDLIFSHPGSYLLFFSVTYPVEVSLVVTASNFITVLERQQLLDEESKRNSSLVTQTCTPCSLAIKQLTSSNATEGLSLPTEAVPKVALLTCNGSLCTELGNTTWVITVSARLQPDNSFLTNTEAKVSEGIASFDDLIFSHPGSYLLFFSVTYPEEVSLVATASNFITVLERQLEITIVQQPQQGNTSFPLYPYPTIHLVDTSSGSLVSDHSWRNTTWYAEVTVLGSNQEVVRIRSNQEVVRILLTTGIGTFTNIYVFSAGDYKLEFSAYQISEDNNVKLDLIQTISDGLTIIFVPTLRITYTYNTSYSIIANNESDFISIFKETFLHSYPDLEVVNITLSNEGRMLIVLVYVTSRNNNSLDTVAREITLGTNAVITFTFMDTIFVPLNVEVEWTQSTEQNNKNNIVLILVVTILSAMPLSFFIGIAFLCLFRRLVLRFHRRNKVSVARVSSNGEIFCF